MSHGLFKDSCDATSRSTCTIRAPNNTGGTVYEVDLLDAPLSILVDVALGDVIEDDRGDVVGVRAALSDNHHVEVCCLGELWNTVVPSCNRVLDALELHIRDFLVFEKVDHENAHPSGLFRNTEVDGVHPPSALYGEHSLGHGTAFPK